MLCCREVVMRHKQQSHSFVYELAGALRRGFIIVVEAIVGIVRAKR